MQLEVERAAAAILLGSHRRVHRQSQIVNVLIARPRHIAVEEHGGLIVADIVAFVIRLRGAVQAVAAASGFIAVDFSVKLRRA